MPRVISIVIFILGLLNLHAQNLVPNPSFEDYTSCPNNFGMGGRLMAAPWQNGSGTTADYFNACSGNAWVDVPANYFGWQQAHTGSGYAGGYHYHALTVWLEYLQVQLLSPMVAGQFYHVSMYTNRSNYNCAIASIGLYISDTPPPTNGADALLVNPQVVNTGGFLSDTLNWTLIDGYYLAQGGEQWITIGNFEENANTLAEPCGQIPTQTYYYYDDVSVVTAVPCDILDVDLGDDIDVCFEYTIDPELGDYQYVWSNGSTDPTITIYESGVYGLTITDSCSVGFDQIEVNILGITPVELGPDSAMICAGESYEIELDDEFGEYTWNDDSTDPSYTIESSGIYSVTFDDGCAVSADTIVIAVLDPPAPFSLGPDTLLCDDNVYVISFEENLGDFEWSEGSNESTFTIEDEGSYSLTISNGCGEESDDIDVTLGNSPNVELGPDQVAICSGDIISFDLDEDEGSYLWQDSSTNTYYEITLPGLYSVTVTNGCGSYDDQLLVQLTLLPDVNLGNDLLICPAQLPDTLDVSSTGGTGVVWNDGSTSSQLIITTPGMYSVTLTNACGTGADTIQVAVEDILPSVILPNDIILCEGDSIWLFNTGDAGSNLWQNGSITDSILAHTSGTYALAVTTVCGSGHDTVIVEFAPDTLFPNLGPDLALCPGETGTLFTGASFDTYLWPDMSAADSLIISSPGVYTVMVADDCGTGTDTVIVTLSNNPPQVDLVDSVHLCDGQQVTLDAGISGVGFLWSDGSMLSTLAVNVPGEYSLTVSNSCGADIDSIVVVDGGSSPVVLLGPDIQLCEGESQVITAVFNNADSWTWQDGSVDSTISVIAEGEIIIAAINSCGEAHDTLIVSILPAIPLLNIGNDTAVCENETIVLTIDVPGVSITWSDGTHETGLNVGQPGTYYASIENACGLASDTIVVSALLSSPVLNLGNDQSLCPGEVIVIDPAIPDVEYLWHDGSTGTTFSTSVGDTIILMISNACGGDIDSIIIVETTQGPQIDLGPDIVRCVGDTITIDAGIGGVNYVWQDGSTDNEFMASNSGTYILQVSNNCGQDTDTIVVDLSGVAPNTWLGLDTFLCEGNPVLLASTATTGTIITWPDGSTDPIFSVTESGTYSIHESNVCGEHHDTIAVNFITAPDPFTLGPDIILCPGETVILSAPDTPEQLTWQDESHGVSIEANMEQLYTLEISNACGIASDSLTLTFEDNAPLLDTDTVFICPGDLLVLDVAQPAASYTWSTGSHESSITVQVPGNYAVTVFTTCFEVSDIIPVAPGDDCKPKTTYYIPNIFSPNGDQVNDVFSIYFNDDAIVIGVFGDIFDRWGNHVFASDKHPFTWDGSFNGQPMNPGVYVFRFRLEYSNGINTVIEVLSGDVTLIR